MPPTRSGSCRNVRIKRTMRTKSSPQDLVECLTVKRAMGWVGLVLEETQGLGRPGPAYQLFVKFNIFGSFLGFRGSAGGRGK